MKITFGIASPISRKGGDLRKLLEETTEQAKLAESVGFDSCLFTEYHQSAEPTFTSPLLVGAAVAARTQQIKVGSIVLPLPLYHPVRLAEDAALLDVISGGRVILGVGIGHVPEHFQGFGVPIGERVTRFEEGMAILNGCWTKPIFSFRGKHFELDELKITPKPAQQPRPPIWIGGSSLPAMRRAARLGDAWVADSIQNRAALAELAASYRAAAKAADVEPRVVLMREAWVGESWEQAVTDYGRHALAVHRLYWRVRAYLEHFDPWLADVKGREDFTLEKVAPDRFILGSPEACVDQILAFQEATGADYFVFRLRHPGGPDHEQVLRAIRTFGEQVLPKL